MDRDKRPEGVYVTKRTYPPEGDGMYSTKLFNIQRVNGDCTVTGVEITKDEARSLIFQLASLGVHQ